MNILEAPRVDTASKNLRAHLRRSGSHPAQILFEAASDVLVREGAAQGHRKYMVIDVGSADIPVNVKIQSDPFSPWRRNPAYARRIDVIVDGGGWITVKRKSRQGKEVFHASAEKPGDYSRKLDDRLGKYSDTVSDYLGVVKKANICARRVRVRKKMMWS